MQSLINTVWKGLQWAAFNIGDWMGEIWSGFLVVASFFTDWLQIFFVNLTGLVVEGVFGLVLFVVELLPTMPEAGAAPGVAALLEANRYVALGEVLAFTGIWATLFSGVGVYKLVKLIRGGG